jgi:nitrogen fixation protein FixH
MTTPRPSPSSRPALPEGRFRAFVASGRIWPWVPGLLLVGLIGSQLAILGSALDDPTFATEDDYYRKAVDWDAHMARERQSIALGWSATARISDSTPLGSAVSVRLLDARGSALTAAQVHAVAFHNARAAHPLRLELRESEPGEYAADLGAAKPGLWELRLAATHGSDSFETTLRFEVPGRGST